MPPLCAAAMHARATRACSGGLSFSTRAAPLAARTAAAAAAAAAAAPRQQRRGSLITPRAFTLEPVDASGNGSGKALEFDQAKVVLGSSAAADVRLPSGDGIEPEHATLTQRGRSLFLTALSGESVLDPSGAFIDGEELRPRVGYVLASGSVLAFGGDGSGGARFRVRFEEPTGGGPLAAMLLAGATAGASADVKAAMEDAAKSD